MFQITFHFVQIMRYACVFILCFLLVFIFLSSTSFALIDLSIFGPVRYDRLKGAPTVYTGTFERCNPAAQGILKITNGDSKDTRMTAASIYVNGTEVATENEFKQQVPYFEKVISINESNSLMVELKSGKQDIPDTVINEASFLIIEIFGSGCDSTPPVISNVEPADGSLLNTSFPRISAQYSDEFRGTGIDATTARLILDGINITSSSSVSDTGISYTPSAPLAEGEHEGTITVSDRAHNQASLTWHWTTDTIPPAVDITSHQNDQYVNTPSISLSGLLDDASSSVTVNGQTAEVSGNGFSLANLSLTEGANTIAVEARDRAGNLSAQTINITLDTIAPVIQVTTPLPNSFVNTPTITVSGSITELISGRGLG